MPPSAGACQTTSACDSPDCGRAGRRSSIITAIGCRRAIAGSTRSPVSGAATVTGVGTAVGVATGVGLGDAVGEAVVVGSVVAVDAGGTLAWATGEGLGDPPMIPSAFAPTTMTRTR